MAEAGLPFEYVAVDPSGRRVRGQISAPNDRDAFERLKRDGLSPITIKAGGQGRTAEPRGSKTKLSDRDLAALLADLAALTGAGADMRSAFAILSARADGAELKATARALSADIGGGEGLESAFAKHLPARLAFIAALIAAGEASGSLSQGFERAAEILSARLKLRDQFVTVVSYPAFVFASTIAAFSVIVFFVIPSLAPLIEDSPSPPAFLAAMIAFSHFFTANAAWLAGGLAILIVAGLAAGSAGLLRGPFEAALLDGPMRRTAGAIVYGGFSVTLGAMLAGGAPMAEALRLATRSVAMTRARSRLEVVAGAVRQGTPLSNALEGVHGFPAAISRLTAVGEATGAMGGMIARAGRLEEERALRRLEQAGRILGPALIVILGAAIGLLMAGLLSGVSQLGQSALS
jgi:type II secretory pathway component PulF